MIILFDSDCVLCSAWVRLVLRHERAPVARFVSAWSEEGLALAAEHGLTAEDLDQTFLAVDDGQGLTKSDAIFAVLSTLRAPWRWARALRVIPRPLRDWAYDRLARNRYRLFGRRDQCFVPGPGQADRFVSGPPRR